LKETDGEKRLQPYSIQWARNVTDSSSFALPDPEPGLELLSCVL